MNSFLVSLVVAHAVGLSQGEYTRTADGVSATLTFTESEIRSLSDEPASWVAQRIRLEGCAVEQSSERIAENDGLMLEIRWACTPRAPDHLELGFLDEMLPGHRHLIGPKAFSASDKSVALGQPISRGFGSFVRLGVEHILEGWDHLLFLLGMVLVLSKKREILAVVTAFTVAHSVTLALTVLGVVAPNPRWVEPLIALSVAWVGIENLVRGRGDGRWRIAFAFGLLHGFGFAGALGDLGTEVSRVPWALIGFNVGVEFGQLAVLTLVLPPLAFARADSKLWLRLSPALSLAVVVPGVIACIARLGG